MFGGHFHATSPAAAFNDLDDLARSAPIGMDASFCRRDRPRSYAGGLVGFSRFAPTTQFGDLCSLGRSRPMKTKGAGAKAVAYGVSDSQYLAWVVVDDDPSEMPDFWPV